MRLPLCAALIASIGSCGAAADGLFCDTSDCLFSSTEWRRVQALSPMPPVPAEPTNRYRDLPQAAELGQSLFFDAAFSGPATQVDALHRPSAPARAPAGQATGVSCATCHDLGRGGADVSSVPGNVSVGAGWTDVNALGVVNSAFSRLWFWNGRADSSWALAALVAESATTVNGDRLKIAYRISERYLPAYNAVFGAGHPFPRDLSMAQANLLVDPASSPPGQCRLVGGACPAGCNPLATGCWPRFPLEGKPGTDSWASMSPDDQTAVTRVLVNWAKALDAYQARLVSGETPFDRFVAGGPGTDAISTGARRGARLFVGKAGCVDCHSGPLLSDGLFHNVAVPQAGPAVPTLADCTVAACDCGGGNNCLPWGQWDGMKKLSDVMYPRDRLIRFRRDSEWSDEPTDTSRRAAFDGARTDAMKGAWRTPSLRNVALTAPYMHDGLYRTLAEVVAHYAAGGAAAPVGTPAAQLKPIALTATEQSDLVSFLESLTAGPLPAELTTPPVAP